MADNRERNQGLREGTSGGMGGGQHAPSRNPQDDRLAGGKQAGKQIDFEKKGNLGGPQEGIKRGYGSSYKEGR